VGIIVKQSLSNLLISYAGISLGFLLTILLYPHILSPDEYGLTRVLFSASFISTQFAHLGFQNLVIRYFPVFKRAAPGNHGFLFWVCTIPIFGFLLFAGIYYAADSTIIAYYAEQSPLFVDYYLWVLPLTLFILYFEILNNYLRSLRDSVSGSFAMEIIQRLITIALLGGYFFDWITFHLFIMLFVLSYLMNPLIVAIQIARKGEWKFRPNMKLLRRPLIKGMANYGLFSMLGGLTTVIVWNVDILMLGSLAGLDQTAVYAIAFYMASVIAIPQRSINKIVSPLLADFIKNKEWDEVGSIYIKSSLNQLIPGMFIFGLIWINLDVVYQMMPEFYSAGKWVVFIVGIGKIIEMITGANGLILINSRHYRVSFYTNLVLIVVTIGANYIMIPRFGIEGAAMASVLAILVYNSTKYIWVLVKMRLQPFTKKTVLVTLLGAAALSITQLFTFFDFYLTEAIVNSMIFVILFGGPVIYFSISEDLNMMLEDLVEKWKR
jgi:O-antigen/teichoic acid export membrane protein